MAKKYTAVVERMYNKNKTIRHEYVLKIFDNSKFSNGEELVSAVNTAVADFQKQHRLRSFHINTEILPVEWDYNENYL